MPSDEAASGQGAMPFDSGDWDADLADDLSDPAAANLFTAEIEHVDASDWDVDTALIWGDDVDDVGADGGTGLDGGLGLEFPL